MPEHLGIGMNSGRHSFVQGIGWVPSGPRFDTRHGTRTDSEEGEILEVPSGPRVLYSDSPDSEGGSQHQNFSSESIPHWTRHRSQLESIRSCEVQDWESWDSRGSHEWHRRFASHEGQSVPRGRDRGDHTSSQSRSRSRSPSRRRGCSQEMFVRAGDIQTHRNKSPALSQAPNLEPLPLLIPPIPRALIPCQCPISDRCRCRSINLHDCRALVPDLMARIRRKVLEWETVERPPRGLSVSTQRVSATLKKFANYFERLQGPNPRRHQIQNDLENWTIEVQKLDFSITAEAIVYSRVLPTLDEFLSEEQQALRTALEISSALVEDLAYLFRKWESGDLDNHPDRGLLYQRSGKSRYGLALDKSWKHCRSGNYYGAGHLVTGQRWPSRLHMRRDGAHDPPEAGISGSTKLGARSAVMGLDDRVNDRIYADRDMGEIVRYIGTENTKTAKANTNTNTDTNTTVADDNDDLSNEEQEEAGDRPSVHTRMLMKSKQTGNPVRLFRSSKFSDTSPYTPTEGYRYDGLYTVRSYRLLSQERQIYRFKMRRVPGQPPLRAYDDRTFELTPEAMAKARRRKEAGRQYRERMDQNHRSQDSGSV